MRRGGTTLVVLVVAAIALAAGFDALRGDDPPQPAAESEPTPAPPTTTADEPVEEEPPLTEGLGGTLYFTDESCELQAIELPPGPRAAGPPDPPNWDECRFALSPNGQRVAGADTGWDPYSDPLIGRVFQSRDATIQVSTNAGPEGEPFPGRAPAWRPDGTLTYFADGAVREWPSGDVVLSQRDLVRALRTLRIPELSTRYDRYRVREAAWLDDRRLAAILSAEGPEFREDMLAIYDGTELAQHTFDAAGGLSELRVSPGGRYAAAKSNGGRDAPGGFVMIEDGRELSTPRIDGYRAIAWSPDDQWAAVAADGGVFVFRPGEPGPPELELGLYANDLDWRGELGLDAVPASGDTTEAAAYLAGAGVDGLLYFTQQNEGRCRLRALEIPTLESAEAPPDSQGFCRFTVEPDGLIRPGGVGGVAATPSGRPTYVLDGELFAGQPGNRTELLVSGAKLEELFGAPAALEEVAWVDEERFWAVVRSEGADGIALMTADAVVYAPWFAAPTIEGLRVGPGGMVAAGSDRGVAILGDDGRRRLILTNGRDVAWAPGEPIAAVSTRDGILFVAPLSGEEVAMPLEVSDLDWVAP